MIECKNCGNELNKKQKSFCSANCKNKFQTKNKKPQTCEVCKDEYFNKNSKFCSIECKRSKTWEIRTCKICNNKFEARKVTKKEMCSDECRKEWGSRPENKEYRMKRTREAINEKYGVDSIFELEEIHEQITEKLRNKTDEENSKMIAKLKATKKKKYGDENYNNMDKNKQTKLKNHGDENYNNREKFNETLEEKYGGHHLKLDEFMDKQKKTNKEKFGFDFPMQNQDIRNKALQTNIEKYGESCYNKTEEGRKNLSEKLTLRWEDTKLYSLMRIHDLELLDKFRGIAAESGGTWYNYYKFKCNKCDNIFVGTFASYRVPICRICYPMNKNPLSHKVISDMLNKYNIKYYDNVRNLISPLELDFYLPDYNLAVELNGNYYHSEIGGGKSKKYHLHKTEECNKKDIKLIHIFEDELKLQENIVLSRLLNMLNLSENKIYGRKCIIKEIDIITKIEFLEKNHIQGNTTDKIRVGLYHENKLVSLMTFGKLRKITGNNNKEGSYELIRFCSLINHNIVGSFSKLLKYFINEYNPTMITTYADIRWSGINELNNVYTKNGFTFVHKSPPSYHYFLKKDYMNRQHRFNYRKSVLKDKLETFDPKLTEWENMQLNEYDRIWDCGSLKFELNCKNYLGM